MQDYPDPEGVGKRVGEDVRFLVEPWAQPGGAVKPSRELPTWESFPTGERQLLVTTIVQTARRRVQTRLTTQP